MNRFISLALCLLATACVGTTGGDLLELKAFAAGPEDAAGGMTFRNSQGYEITLDDARLFVGGLYLNRSRATSVAADTSCTLPGIYGAQVSGGLEVDLLSAAAQPFPEVGFATSDRSVTGEVWLSDGDVNDERSTTVILRGSGSAERAGIVYPFRLALSIGNNRVIAPTDAALPGQHPICKQRIVSPIAVELLPVPGKALLLRADPRGMFANVDFSTLAQDGDHYSFADQSGVNQASDNLYAGLRRSSGVYTLSLLEE